MNRFFMLGDEKIKLKKTIVPEAKKTAQKDIVIN